jgi:hypothetical protein
VGCLPQYLDCLDLLSTADKVLELERQLWVELAVGQNCGLPAGVRSLPAGARMGIPGTVLAGLRGRLYPGALGECCLDLRGLVRGRA